MILGLDVSTSCTGYCILDNNKDIVDIGYIILKKEKDLCSKGDHIKKIFETLQEKYNIEKVYIEEPFQRFGRGLSSAATITRLASFNGIVQYISYHVFDIYPIMINVNKARKALDIKLMQKKKCGIDTKDQVFNWVKNEIPNLDWPTKIMKSGPRRGQEVLIPECLDMSDAYVIARAGFVNA